MRRSTKGFLVTALLCGIVGAAFCIVSLCLGFRPEELSAKAASGELEFVGPSGWREKLESAVDNTISRDRDFDESYEDVHSLDLEIGAGNCVLIPSDEENWRVKGHHLPSGFQAKMSGSTLEIDCPGHGWRFWGLIGDKSATLEIYIPKKELIRELAIECGAGEVTMEEGWLKCQLLDLECGAGDSDLWLDIQKSAAIECGVGDVTLNVLGDASEFNYSVETGIGEVVADGKTHGGLGSSERVDRGADKSLDLECGIGSAKLYFLRDEWE